MAEAEAVERFLRQHPTLRLLPPGKRVQCTLTGHEVPCKLAALQAYTSSKKYLRLSKVPGVWDYREYEPYIVPSTKNPHQLFCKLTLRHINRIPEHVLLHVQGQRYQKALKKYEECQKEGVKYIPACLLQRQRRQQQDDQPNSSQQPHQNGEFWEPLPSDEEGEKTDDSMSDLYPPKLFPEKSPAGKEGTNEFMTDSDEDVAKPAAEDNEGSKEMDVDSATGSKRGKVRRERNKWGPSRRSSKGSTENPSAFRK
ncbi:surfeit locus protein 2 isoform X2 [Eublepharis macularius]|uniref:Surfeit locus protein 2 isoform X2 n=1 Tax=Eublepharis macularius TaxID=481883 RepID=A0AA97LFH2_EUBMA|nr:surfeit locus protein 2 isoform X2 [Eublepharis macularius]XP_054853290.1 surfeit locus protein 2 isoform X2 [Eublepharis macularius]XP_054853291.1 surfeit locus protein 2 isoform X2 [Eublepharis macularius]XP_054853292.1 surfeit locus protein 2 isoform X2 [Eublepharis macularius]